MLRATLFVLRLRAAFLRTPPSPATFLLGRDGALLTGRNHEILSTR